MLETISELCKRIIRMQKDLAKARPNTPGFSLMITEMKALDDRLVELRTAKPEQTKVELAGK